MRLRAIATIVAIAGLALASPAAAETVTEVAKAGDLTATLSYETSGDFLDAKDVRLDVAESGGTIYTHEFKPICKGCFMAPVEFGKKAKPVQLRNLDPDPDPEIVTGLYTGGAHCCSYVEVFDRGAETYARSRFNFLDAGFRLNDLDDDGAAEFRSADARFAYKYAPFALSALPAQVIGLVEGSLADVTRQFRLIVRKDARGQKRRYRRERGKVSVRATLAAYTADRCSLGSCKKGFALVKKARERGELKKQERFEFGLHGKRYVRSLRRFLRRLDYR